MHVAWSDPYVLTSGEGMEATGTEIEDKPGLVDSEEDENVEEDTEEDPKVLLGRKIYNYNKQVDAELFRLQLREVQASLNRFVYRQF